MSHLMDLMDLWLQKHDAIQSIHPSPELVSEVPIVPDVPIVTEVPSVPVSWYRQKLLEQSQQKAEQHFLNSLHEKSKINWKKVRQEYHCVRDREIISI